MKIIKSLDEWKVERKTIDLQSIGFVATMGNLHAGHVSLLKKSVEDNQKTVLSIFVNPTQFNDPNDFNKYPKTLDADCLLAQNTGVDYIFLPTKDMMYPDNYVFRISENNLSSLMEGVQRPGHFDGMLTVVLKLLNIVRPQRAYFGEKDRQQLMLVQGMVRALCLGLEVVPCPTIREANGLAMSSRNGLLSSGAREFSGNFYWILKEKITIQEATQQLERIGFGVEYVEDHENYRFGAVRIENVRLIDNVSLN